jgi:hypothetical protein
MGSEFDRGMREGFSPVWKVWFDGTRPVKAWLEAVRPDQIVVIYNDHLNFFEFEAYPTLAIGVAEQFPQADEGWGKRPYPDLSNYAVLAEAMLTAERYGIEPGMFVDIVSASTGQSFLSSVVMKNFVLTEKFNTGFAVGLLAKDAAIAAELCKELGFDAPHVELASQRWAQARDVLGAGEDNSKAISVWRYAC